MSSTLSMILKAKRAELREARRKVPPSEIERRAESVSPRTGLFRGLVSGFRIIAEVKKASPSRGVIREDFDPEAIAKAYVEAGADALSVLTDRKFFQGAPEHLAAIASWSPVPVLRKDFIIEEYQIHEAKALGAGVVLLIVACLPDWRLRRFLMLCRRLGLESLTEVHDRQELDRALDGGAEIVGINNRDLRTFRTDLAVSLDLIRHVPPQIPCVSESGIRDRGDVLRLKEAGFRGVLVGETLMSAVDPGEALRSIRP